MGRALEATGGGPLADRMRPTTLAEFAGQTHLLGEGKPLRRLIEAGKVHSMLFWGPPGEFGRRRWPNSPVRPTCWAKASPCAA